MVTIKIMMMMMILMTTSLSVVYRKIVMITVMVMLTMMTMMTLYDDVNDHEEDIVSNRVKLVIISMMAM